MCVDEFLDGRAAIAIPCDTSFEAMLSFQCELESYAGREIARTQFADGFADYCMKIITYVVSQKEVSELEVCYENDNFSYTADGRNWFINRGYSIIPFVVCAEELNAKDNPVAVSIEELESVLN